jgi:chloramphenicol-sensitive protein RarD
VDDRRPGLAFGLGAYALWGLFPLYFPLLEPAGGLEIVAHRVVWSLVFVALLLTVLRSWARVRSVVADRRALLILVGAAMAVSANWLIFVYGVNSGQVVETSLGYFINPLLSVLLGVVVLGERLRRPQWGAVAIAAAGVAVLTVDNGRPPWIALGLAVTFGLYGLLKKLVRVEAAPGLLLETAIAVVPAVAFLAVLHAHGEGTAGNAGTGHLLLLAGSGVLTAVPLLLFAGATSRIPLSTVGLLQYLTPSMQLAIGVFVYGEPMPTLRLVGFAIVWLALAVFTVDSLRAARAYRRRVVPAVPAGL